MKMVKIKLLPAKGTQKNTKTNPLAKKESLKRKRSNFLHQIIELLKKEDVV